MRNLPRHQAACRKKIGVANTLAVRRPEYTPFHDSTSISHKAFNLQDWIKNRRQNYKELIWDNNTRCVCVCVCVIYQYYTHYTVPVCVLWTFVDWWLVVRQNKFAAPWWSKLPASVESMKCANQRINTIQTGGNLQAIWDVLKLRL